MFILYVLHETDFKVLNFCLQNSYIHALFWNFQNNNKIKWNILQCNLLKWIHERNIYIYIYIKCCLFTTHHKTSKFHLCFAHWGIGYYFMHFDVIYSSNAIIFSIFSTSWHHMVLTYVNIYIIVFPYWSPIPVRFAFCWRACWSQSSIWSVFLFLDVASSIWMITVRSC